MAGNNLMETGTGLDHLFLDGFPVIESRVSMDEVYSEVSRITGLSVMADPYFINKPELVKSFSQLHGKGSRIARDFLLRGAKDILPVFQSLQRLIPEGFYDAKPLAYEFAGQDADWSWNNPEPGENVITALLIKGISGDGDLTIFANGVELGTISLPDYVADGSSYLSYDIAGWLGAANIDYTNWSHSENLRNDNPVATLSLVVSNASSDFVFDVKVVGVMQNIIGWKKALFSKADVRLPEYRDSIVASYLLKDFTWSNKQNIRVAGVTVRCIDGSAWVRINNSGTEGNEVFITSGTIIGDDYFDDWGDVQSIEVSLRDATLDFRYEVSIDAYVQSILPSPRFQFDGEWEKDVIIYRWLNMDTRASYNKLNYTSDTARNKRVDTNNFENVEIYLVVALKDYMLRELYQAIGYDKKYQEYKSAYSDSRADVAYWVKNNVGYQSQYGHG